ncbi:hypothetical protein CBR_g76006 [Chara braunii]|uniref:USP domain-containing protein n=1 Tax=Chara braunii TaxID=69332 RepID=A0A388JJS3_CHABU|nr:hypothetical protein CBR_g76006 [Chara braunii]|eukprot:GBG42572.1 hypothetical protein CBR_g76006 [Chara braunii]
MWTKFQGGDVERAAEWVFSHPDVEAMEIDASNRAAADAGNAPAQRQRVPAAEDMRDGPGKYKLMAFISHMGSSTQVGHYVCHIVKDGRWVIFNDSKVAASGDPPKDMGYLYFFERVRPTQS